MHLVWVLVYLFYRSENTQETVNQGERRKRKREEKNEKKKKKREWGDFD